MLFRQLFDRESSTYTYLIADLETKEALLVDPTLNCLERDLKVLQELDLTLRYCLETHIHADHITGTARLRTKTDCLGVMPAGAEAACADRQLGDNEVLQLGSIWIQAIATPGHTAHHNAYLINRNYLLTGDALLIRGCGRTDFQGGDAGELYDSVNQKLFTLPDDTQVYPGHDYRGHTISTIGEERRFNPRFLNRNREEFIDFMGRLNLPNPKMMMEAVPANERCGNVEVPASV